MMLDIIHGLLAGDETIADKFSQAKSFWDEFFAKNRGLNESELAKALSQAQWRVEGIFGRGTGKSVMPYTALGALYDPGPGFEDNSGLAKRVVAAFAASSCSMEVKFAARRAASLYHLD